MGNELYAADRIRLLRESFREMLAGADRTRSDPERDQLLLHNLVGLMRQTIECLDLLRRTP